MAKKKSNLSAATMNPNTRAILEASGIDTGATTPPPEPAQEEKPAGVVRTNRGYVTTDGTEKVRVSLHLTKEQRARLKELAFDTGKDVTEYIVEKLGL